MRRRRNAAQSKEFPMKRRSVLTSIGCGLLAQIPFFRAPRAGSAMRAENWFAATPESASAAEKPKWQMKADYVEACSCHLFCPCYFNKHAEHPHCEFNMAIKVREGYSGSHASYRSQVLAHRRPRRRVGHQPEGKNGWWCRLIRPPQKSNAMRWLR